MRIYDAYIDVKSNNEVLDQVYFFVIGIGCGSMFVVAFHHYRTYALWYEDMHCKRTNPDIVGT